MNQPQPQPQQNADTPINSSYDNLTAEQKYENLTKENRTIPQFSTSIFSGSSF
ncbi:4853_t:CDS:2 [Gigaspora margarita]|uniref:4853_t:CDS:1 n=1 Tax=Gigaspora margarita TaxID=4874 RepID=A0ABN7UTK0_GIGMA|nr:4853_t:CDS:2 [Gigaspora margarita]